MYPRKRLRAKLSTAIWKKIGQMALYLDLNTERQPILIVSLPRSGSSWIGDILSSASNVRYLREPITQSRLNFGNYQATLIGVDPQNPSKDYETFANMAFRGYPTFRGEIVSGYRRDWFSQKEENRVIIKEVNILALEFFIKKYNPYVVFVVRHPAAVALSFSRLGWFKENSFFCFCDRLTVQQTNLVQQQLKRQISPNRWEQYGALQGASLNIALTALVKHCNYKIVFYEDLCLDPISGFQHIFSHTGLQWNKEVKENIDYKSFSSPQYKDPYSTVRYSSKMVRSWRQEITPEILDAIKTGFFSFPVPFYTSDREWNTEIS